MPRCSGKSRHILKGRVLAPCPDSPLTRRTAYHSNSVIGSPCGRIGWVPDLSGQPVEGRVLEAARESTALLARMGVQVETVSTPWPEAPLDALFVLHRV